MKIIHESRFNEIKVGLLVFTGFLLMVFAYWMIKGIQLSSGGYHIYVTFSSLEGVSNGSDVKLAKGIKIGFVEETAIEDNNIKVKIWLKETIKITRGTEISITSSSILGEKFISISSTRGKGELLKNGDSIEGSAPHSINSSIKQFGIFMENLNNLIRGDKNGGLIKDIKIAMKNTTTSLELLLSKTKTDIKKTFKSINTAASKMNSILNDFKGVGKDVSSLMKKMQKITLTAGKMLPQTLIDIRTSAQKMNKLLTTLNGKTGLAGALFNDRKMLIDMKFILDNLKRLTYKLMKDPSSILWNKKQ